MEMPPFENILSEFLYTFIIVVFCSLIFWKTREIYQLTKYKGIKYFRNTFLFLGISYLFRFVAHLLMMTTIVLDYIIPRKIMMGITMLPVSYLSTMALFYLMYSLIWKKIDERKFLAFSNIIAIIVSIAAFMTRSPEILVIIQLTLLAFTGIITLIFHKGHKLTNRLLYLMIFIFWLVSLFTTGPGRLIPHYFKMPVQIISALVFIAIYYKVAKWA